MTLTCSTLISIFNNSSRVKGLIYKKHCSSKIYNLEMYTIKITSKSLVNK